MDKEELYYTEFIEKSKRGLQGKLGSRIVILSTDEISKIKTKCKSLGTDIGTMLLNNVLCRMKNLVNELWASEPWLSKTKNYTTTFVKSYRYLIATIRLTSLVKPTYRKCTSFENSILIEYSDLAGSILRTDDIDGISIDDVTMAISIVNEYTITVTDGETNSIITEEKFQNGSIRELTYYLCREESWENTISDIKHSVVKYNWLFDDILKEAVKCSNEDIVALVRGIVKTLGMS